MLMPDLAHLHRIQDPPAWLRNVRKKLKYDNLSLWRCEASESHTPMLNQCLPFYGQLPSAGSSAAAVLDPDVFV